MLPDLTAADVLFEFAIPRMGKRADVALLSGGLKTKQERRLL